jgi:gas vesicle protein
MDDKNPRIGGERISGQREETARGRLETAEPITPAATHAATPRPSSAARRTSASRSVTATAGSSTTRTDFEGDEPRTKELRADIEQTREELSETVNAIQERLRPANVMANAKETVKNAALDRARDVAESEPVQYVRSNPLPVAMIGIGLAGVAILAFGDRGRHRDGWRRPRMGGDWRTTSRFDRADGTTGYYEPFDRDETYRGTMNAAGYGEAEESFGRRWGYEPSFRENDWSGRSRQILRRQQRQIRRTWDENPLIVGAASLVLGTVVGLAIPATERENQLMGDARDSMVESVQDKVREKVDEVQEVAAKTVDTVKDAAANLTGLSSSSDRHDRQDQ